MDGTCDLYFNDPLFAATIEEASNDSNSSCAGERSSAPSAACLALLWPGVFQMDATAELHV